MSPCRVRLTSRLPYSPQLLGATSVTVACTMPRCSAWLFVSLFIAARAMLNPDLAWSMARTLIVLFLYFSCQHVPQLGEFQPTGAYVSVYGGHTGDKRQRRTCNSLRTADVRELGQRSERGVAWMKHR